MKHIKFDTSLFENILDSNDNSNDLEHFEYDPAERLWKVSVNLTNREQSILEAINYLPECYLGKNKSDVIKTLIRLGWKFFINKAEDPRYGICSSPEELNEFQRIVELADYILFDLNDGLDRKIEPHS